MPTKRFVLSLILIVGVISDNIRGQEAHHPRISFVHPGPEVLRVDLRSVFDLTSPEEQESWVDLEDILIIMSSGVDPERPARMDVLTGVTPVNYLIWLPFADDDGLFELRDNLDAGLGFQTIREPGQPNLYRIESLDNELDEGWFRVISRERYAVLVMTTPETRESMKQVVLRIGDPLPDVAALVKLGTGAAVAVVNTTHDAESLEKRCAAIGEIRVSALEALERRPSERITAFNLRRVTWSIMLREMERVLAEVANIQAWGDLDRNNHTASFQFRATAIPETLLATAISEFGRTPDAFAGISRLPDHVFSGRLNHPLDAVRQESLNAYADATIADIEARVAVSQTLSASEKEATSTLTAGVADLIRDVVASGNINGFAEAAHDGATFTMVGALSAPNATRLIETLKQLPLASADNSVEFGIASVDGVTIHRIRLAEGFVNWADRLFDIGNDYYLGVDADRVWMATGPGAQEVMMQKISEFGEAAVSNTALRVDVRLHPWIRRMHELAEEEEMPEALEDRRAWREDLVLMKQALESLITDDEIHLEVSAEQSEVSGIVTFQTGLLRFIGHRLAKFSKENLGVD